MSEGSVQSLRGVKRSIALIMIAALLATNTGLVGSSQDGSDMDFPQLLLKADPILQEAVLDGQMDDFEIIVTGPPHENVKQIDYVDRWEAMADLERRAAPFLSTMSDLIDHTGTERLGSWPAVPALKLKVDLQTLIALSESPKVRHLSLDHDNAVRLVEPMAVDGVAPQNEESRIMVGAEEAWAAGYRGEDVVLAVLDTGIDPSHEAFYLSDGRTRIAGWKDVVSGRGVPYDDHGHGTHVAATAAGSDDYNHPKYGTFEETGVAPGAKLYVVKLLNSQGGGTLQNILDGLQAAFDGGADVTSNSWGGHCSVLLPSVSLVRQFTDLGMVSVFAAGNVGPDDGTIIGPACGDSSIAVGAVDADRVIADFSSRGPCTDPESGDVRTCPDVVAKGVSVRSAIPRGGATVSDVSGYYTWGGTSMATPAVAGVLAIAEQMRRAHYDQGWDTVSRSERLLLHETSNDLGPPDPDNDYGWGLPDLVAILDRIKTPADPQIIANMDVTQNDLRIFESTQLRFNLRNHGTAVASGPLNVTLTYPDGSVLTLLEEEADLGLFDGESVVHELTVLDNVPPGEYVFEAEFIYDRVDPEAGHAGESDLRLEERFDVQRVFIDTAIEGFSNKVAPAEIQELTLSSTNAGNHGDASNVVIDFTVPDEYQFVPGPYSEMTDPTTWYSDPPPSQVFEHPDGRVTLRYQVGAMQVDGKFPVNTNLLSPLTGEHAFLVAARYVDDDGHSIIQSTVFHQEVDL